LAIDNVPENLMAHNEFHRWNLDRRYFYVWFWDWNNAFATNESGPHLAVCDDFGDLVHVATL
jgi:hypothetical protein